jgi:hypothetical protein
MTRGTKLDSVLNAFENPIDFCSTLTPAIVRDLEHLLRLREYS